MAYVPTKPAFSHVFLAKQMLLACSTWLDLFDDQAEVAAEQVAKYEIRICNLTKSHCVIKREDGWQRERVARGGAHFRQAGALEFGFMLRVPQDSKWGSQTLECDEDELEWASDVVGNIILEMEALTDTGIAAPSTNLGVAHLGFMATSIENGPWIWTADELPDVDGVSPYSDGANARYVAVDIAMEIQ